MFTDLDWAGSMTTFTECDSTRPVYAYNGLYALMRTPCNRSQRWCPAMVHNLRGFKFAQPARVHHSAWTEPSTRP